MLLVYLLRGETDPWMFHQANLRAYDGVHSLLGDLIDATLAKLAARSTVPVLTPADGGHRRALRDAHAVRARRRARDDLPRPCPPHRRGSPASVPVTGLRAEDGEAYGGDSIGLVPAIPGQTRCVPLDLRGSAAPRRRSASVAPARRRPLCWRSATPRAPRTAG